MKETLTRADVIAELAKLRGEKPLEELARRFGYKSAGAINDVLTGRRAPNKKILSRLRLKREKVEQYRRIA